MATPIEYNATADMRPTIVDTKLRLVAGLAEILRGDADKLALSFKHTEQLSNVVNVLQEMTNDMDRCTAMAEIERDWCRIDT